MNIEAVFTSYIQTVIRNKAIQILRSSKKYEREVYLQDIPNCHEGQTGYLEDSMTGSIKLDMNYITNEKLFKALAKLNQRDLLIMEMVICGFTDKEIAEQLFIARQTANKIKLKTIRKLRNECQ